MHCVIELDSKALIHNYQQFCKLLGKNRTMPVLKSNAYGHGLKEIYGILAKENPEYIGLNYLEEAKELRALGFQGQILIVGPVLADDLALANQFNCELVIGHKDILKFWLKLKTKPKIHIKIDSGLSRQGFLPEELSQVLQSLTPFKEWVVGISTHFANVEDVTHSEFANHQLSTFQNASQLFVEKGFTPKIHAASSASALIMETSRLDLCRIGISLFGLWPSEMTRLSYNALHGNSSGLQLKPVLSWKTKITNVKTIKKGNYIGYGCTFRTEKEMQIAILSVGYYEGYPRVISAGQAYVLIEGRRCQLVGRICMNMMIVDVTGMKQIKVGDEVVLIGKSKDETLTAGQIAAWANSIHYEIVTRLHPSIPRRWVPH